MLEGNYLSYDLVKKITPSKYCINTDINQLLSNISNNGFCIIYDFNKPITDKDRLYFCSVYCNDQDGVNIDVFDNDNKNVESEKDIKRIKMFLADNNKNIIEFYLDFIINFYRNERNEQKVLSWLISVIYFSKNINNSYIEKYKKKITEESINNDLIKKEYFNYIKWRLKNISFLEEDHLKKSFLDKLMNLTFTKKEIYNEILAYMSDLIEDRSSAKINEDCEYFLTYLYQNSEIYKEAILDFINHNPLLALKDFSSDFFRNIKIEKDLNENEKNKYKNSLLIRAENMTGGNLIKYLDLLKRVDTEQNIISKLVLNSIMREVPETIFTLMDFLSEKEQQEYKNKMINSYKEKDKNNKIIEKLSNDNKTSPFPILEDLI